MFVWGALLSIVTTGIFYFVDPDEEQRERAAAERALLLGEKEQDEVEEEEEGQWYTGPTGAQLCDSMCFPTVLASATSPAREFKRQ